MLDCIGRKIRYNGESLTVNQLAVRYGIRLHTLRQRLRNEWPLEIALEAPRCARVDWRIRALAEAEEVNKRLRIAQ